MNLVEKVRRAGVVGAGGAGFPTHIKLASKAEIVIANGAECEPLLRKDAVVMERFAAEVVRGMQLAMEATGAKKGFIGIKGKNKHAIDAIRSACEGTAIEVFILGDYYPAGDEYDLVYSVTGRLIPPAGIPIQVGVVVNNVETLLNIARADANNPVIKKTITITGAVRKPCTITVPVGISYRECIEIAGGLTTERPVLLIGGLMMGQLSEDIDLPVTKTSTGVVILPRDHYVVGRKLLPEASKAKIGKSACDQCRYCTEYCPRFLLGYPVEPHQVMRSLAFTATGSEYWNQFAALCCACGLCTLYACPEGLFPKEACDSAKEEMRKLGVKWTGNKEVKPHPMRDGRRVPVKTLIKKLHIAEYDLPAPYLGEVGEPQKVVLPLKQSAGTPNRPLVKAGDRVEAGQQIGEVPQGALGAVIHSPIGGKVVAVDSEKICIER
ncbi:MAG: 4Fe-4S dicluster domain-containing protein [Verrucomicrobiia bacterium]